MGKASLPRSPINDTLDANRERKKQFGRERAAFTGVASITTSIGSGINSTATPITSIQSLPTSGGTMSGPIALHALPGTISSGVINVGKSGSYSSRIVINGQSNAADDLEVILNASHAGQLLFLQPATTGAPITLQDYKKTATAWSASSVSYSVGNVVLDGGQRYTCYTAHTSSSATDPSGLSNASTAVWHRNNIHINGATELVVAVNDIILLQYDQSSTGTWIVVSGGGASSGVGLADNNVWTGTNVFENVVTMTGSAVTIGDASSDILNILSGLGSSINVNTHDLQNIDRALFSTTGTDNLGSSDMGIGTNSNDGNYLTYNVPTGYQRFKVGGTLAMSVGPTLNPGLIVENQLYVNGALTSTGNTAFNGNVDIGNSSGDSLTISSTLDAQLRMGNNKITSLATPTTDYDAATKKYVDDNSGGGSSGANTSLSNLTSTGEAHFVKLGNTSNWTAEQNFNAGIDLNGADIDDVETITFDTNNIQIAGASNGLTYTVPSSDAHYFVVDGGTKLQIGSNYTYSLNTLSPGTAGGSALGSSSLPWAGLWCSSIEGTGAWITSGSLSVGGDVWLGNAAADDIHISGTMDTSIKMGANDVDFATGGTVDFYDIASSTVSAGGAQVLPSNPTGYFKVKFRGSDRYIPYYS